MNTLPRAPRLAAALFWALPLDHPVTDEAQSIDYDDLARVAWLVHEAALRIPELDHRPALEHPKGNPRAPSVP